MLAGACGGPPETQDRPERRDDVAAEAGQVTHGVITDLGVVGTGLHRQITTAQTWVEVVPVERGQLGESRGPLRGEPETVTEQRGSQPHGDGQAGGAQPVGLSGVGGRLHVDRWLHRPDGLALLQHRRRGRPARQQRSQIGAPSARCQREGHEHRVTLWGRGDSALVGLIVKGVAGAQVDRVVAAGLVRGRGCVAGEPATGGTDGRAGEPGQHGAAEHASARHRSGGVSLIVIGHCQLAETTFCATVDRL